MRDSRAGPASAARSPRAAQVSRPVATDKPPGAKAVVGATRVLSRDPVGAGDLAGTVVSRHGGGVIVSVAK